MQDFLATLSVHTAAIDAMPSQANNWLANPLRGCKHTAYITNQQGLQTEAECHSGQRFRCTCWISPTLSSRDPSFLCPSRPFRQLFWLRCRRSQPSDAAVASFAWWGRPQDTRPRKAWSFCDPLTFDPVLDLGRAFD